MNLVINKPIYIQIAEEIQFRILAEKYRVGNRIPAIRVLAREFGVNVNTMRKSLCELEKIKIIYFKKGNGTFVTENIYVIDNIKKELKEKYINHILNNLQNLGIELSEIVKLVQQYSN